MHPLLLCLILKSLSSRDITESLTTVARHSPSGGQPNVLRMSPHGRAWRSSGRTCFSTGVSDCAQPIIDIVVCGNVVRRRRAAGAVVSPPRPVISCLPSTSSSARGASRSIGLIGGGRGLEVAPPARSSSSCRGRQTAGKHVNACPASDFLAWLAVRVFPAVSLFHLPRLCEFLVRGWELLKLRVRDLPLS